MKREILCKKIFFLRKTCGYTQSYVANFMGVCRSHYLSIEKGYILISLDELEEISFLYDIPLEWLLNDNITISLKEIVFESKNTYEN